MKFLYAAYIVTWTVHIVYIAILVRGFRKVEEEVRDWER
jgi:CcmD family protein